MRTFLAAASALALASIAPLASAQTGQATNLAAAAGVTHTTFKAHRAAEQFAGFQKGEYSVSLAFDVTHQAGDTTGDIVGQVGMFLNPNVELGLVGAGHFAKGGDTGLVGIFGKYHFMPHGNTAPYVGVEVETTTGFNPNLTMYGGEVGADFFFSPSTAFFAEFFVNGVDHGGDTAYGVRGGIRVFFLPKS